MELVGSRPSSTYRANYRQGERPSTFQRVKGFKSVPFAAPKREEV